MFEVIQIIAGKLNKKYHGSFERYKTVWQSLKKKSIETSVLFQESDLRKNTRLWKWILRNLGKIDVIKYRKGISGASKKVSILDFSTPQFARVRQYSIKYT